MDHLGWSAVAQAVIVATCSWYVRRGSKKDAKVLEHSNQVQLSTSQEILNRIGDLELDMTLVKRSIFRDNGHTQAQMMKGIDHGKAVQP